MSKTKEAEKPAAAEAQISKLNTAPVYANHVNVVNMQGATLIEFRAILPDVSPTSNEANLRLNLDLNQTKELPPHTRIILPLETALGFREALNRVFPQQ